MVFSSLTFIYAFLPVVLTTYYLAPRSLRNGVLLIFSLLFYAWGEPVYIILMLFSSVVDYSLGLLVAKHRQRLVVARLLVTSSVIINLGLLGFFKYSGFLLQNINLALGTTLAATRLPLPIGISFYTFQTMSYTIDVYRGKFPPQRNLLNFATYVTLFPQLIAGPIVRYSDVASQINYRTIKLADFYQGIWRFTVGLGKKVLLANNIGLLWEEISSLSNLSVTSAWLGAFAFGLQIYFDFSGYSDMAIGMGKMLGFDFPENFNYPYLAQSISEFWRRWHISLGSWFRDYVYFPLGGSRVSGARYWFNLLIIWLLTGLWHGAAWNFMLWGLYFGLLIALERLFLAALLRRAPQVWRRTYVIMAVLVSWPLFALDNMGDLRRYLFALFGIGTSSVIDSAFIYYLRTNFLLITILLIACTPLLSHQVRRLSKQQSTTNLISSFAPIALVGLILLATAYLVGDTYNPFLYFRF